MGAVTKFTNYSVGKSHSFCICYLNGAPIAEWNMNYGTFHSEVMPFFMPFLAIVQNRPIGLGHKHQQSTDTLSSALFTKKLLENNRLSIVQTPNFPLANNCGLNPQPYPLEILNGDLLVKDATIITAYAIETGWEPTYVHTL